MEFDRYKGHHKLYIFGIISLILCLSFLFFSLYILPFLTWYAHYDVPDFVSAMISYFQEGYLWSAATASFVVWLLFFIPSLIAGFISYRISNYIDNQLLGIEPKTMTKEEAILRSIEMRRDIRESASLGFKIFMLMLIIVLAILLLQFII